MTRKARRSRVREHYDKYVGYSESPHTPYSTSDAELDTLPEIAPQSIIAESYMSAYRPQAFSSISFGRLETIERTLGKISQEFALTLKAPVLPHLGLTLLSLKRGQNIRKQLRQEGRDPEVMRGPLFRAVQERLGSVASKPLIVFVEAVQVRHKKDSNIAQVNMLLGATAKKEVELVNDALNEVCGQGVHSRPFINLGSITGNIGNESLTALQTVAEGAIFEPLRFGPIKLPEGYPPL